MGCCSSKPLEDKEGEGNNAVELKEVQKSDTIKTKSKRTKSSQSIRIEKAARKEIARERGRRARLDDGHGRDGVCFCAFP